MSIRTCTGQNGRTLPFVLFFLLGLLLGGVVIGEVVRSQYRGKDVSEISGETTLASGKTSEPVSLLSASGSPRRTPVVEATARAVPAVVSITVTQIEVVRDPFYDFDFFGGFFVPDFNTRYREVQALGSGVIFDTLGHILTNHHVVEKAQKILVNLPDGREFAGEIVGSDPASDLAVLLIQGTGLPLARLGDSDSLLLAEPVIAIGNPFGYLMSDPNPTVTTGVVSALRRDFAPDPKNGIVYRNMIQTDAAINQGNSGGPLVNVLGEVVGINTVIVSPNQGGGSVGIGFSIPINKARRVAAELIRYGGRLRYLIGLKIQDIDPQVAVALNLPRNQRGIVVTQVDRGSPADKAGVKVRDVIVGVNQSSIRDSEDIQWAFSEFFANDTVYLIILRGQQKLKVPLALELDRSQLPRKKR